MAQASWLVGRQAGRKEGRRAMNRIDSRGDARPGCGPGAPDATGGHTCAAGQCVESELLLYSPAREYSCRAKVLARPWPWASRAHGGAP